VEQGLFRQDFYFRLKSGHSLQLLSLRNDVARIRSACQFFGMKHSVSFTERLIEFYQTLAWPGNLRQLFGHLEKKRVLSKSFKIDFDNVDEELLLQSSDLASFNAAADIIPYEQHRCEYVKQALKVCQGNIAMTARKLELSEKTVRSIVLK
jgi:transcriptional regulator of acetoin/glycerol metabolism